MLKVTEI